MAKETQAQKDTIERVLHEFKHGELEGGGGQRVKSRRQAIAIGLSEAGTSNRQSPAENKRREGKTEQRERAGGRSKAELYEEAKKRDVPGRSRMSKADLEKAVG